METNLIVEGFKFMALGMGTVFLFLLLMIVVMNVMSAFIHRFLPEPVEAATPPVTVDNKSKVIAAITAAISHYKKGQ
ncbi:MAG TPA: pyruvate carboxylase [Helicobacteraceae bacterium]|nr:pyruvate carboxylase [Helicobacteraceae bacterium]